MFSDTYMYATVTGENGLPGLPGMTGDAGNPGLSGLSGPRGCGSYPISVVVNIVFSITLLSSVSLSFVKRAISIILGTVVTSCLVECSECYAIGHCC